VAYLQQHQILLWIIWSLRAPVVVHIKVEEELVDFYLLVVILLLILQPLIPLQ
jgi:hypothetical protein